MSCLLYTSDAADERSSVDLGGRRIIKKTKTIYIGHRMVLKHNKKKKLTIQNSDTQNKTKKEEVKRRE